MLEPGVVEIGAHRAVVGDGHRLGMVRFGKGGRLVGVAGGAPLFVDEPVVDGNHRVGWGTLVSVAEACRGMATASKSPTASE